MIVTLVDRTVYILTKEQAKKLELSLSKSIEGYVRINGETIKKTLIGSIKNGGFTEADIKPDVRKQNDPKYRIKSDNLTAEERYKNERKAAEKVRKELVKKGLLKRKPP